MYIDSDSLARNAIATASLTMPPRETMNMQAVTQAPVGKYITLSIDNDTTTTTRIRRIHAIIPVSDGLFYGVFHFLYGN